MHLQALRLQGGDRRAAEAEQGVGEAGDEEEAAGAHWPSSQQSAKNQVRHWFPRQRSAHVHLAIRISESRHLSIADDAPSHRLNPITSNADHSARTQL